MILFGGWGIVWFGLFWGLFEENHAHLKFVLFKFRRGCGLGWWWLVCLVSCFCISGDIFFLAKGFLGNMFLHCSGASKS